VIDKSLASSVIKTLPRLSVPSFCENSMKWGLIVSDETYGTDT
jgi:hypothetical protein